MESMSCSDVLPSRFCHSDTRLRCSSTRIPIMKPGITINTRGKNKNVSCCSYASHLSAQSIKDAPLVMPPANPVLVRKLRSSTGHLRLKATSTEHACKKLSMICAATCVSLLYRARTSSVPYLDCDEHLATRLTAQLSNIRGSP